MTTSAFVRRYVNTLKERQIFSTFDVISYGSRSSVDFALAELIRRRRIVRLARGLFMRGDESTPLPSAREVAIAKANAFGNQLIVFEDEQGQSQKSSVQNNEDQEITLLIDGPSSSFKFGNIKIILKPVGVKRLRQLKKREEKQREKEKRIRKNLNLANHS